MSNTQTKNMGYAKKEENRNFNEEKIKLMQKLYK